MNIVPKAQPRTVEGALAGRVSPSPATLSPRERAIAAMNAPAASAAPPQAQPTPVANPNNISPEELSAVKAPSSTDNSGQTDSPEALASQEPSQPQSEPKPTEEPLSSQYVQLARRERQLRAKAQELKAQETALEARIQAAKPQPEAASPGISRERLLKDTWGVLNELGINYDSLTQSALNAPSPEEAALKATIESMKAEIDALKGTQDKTLKSFEDAEKQRYDQAVSQISNEVKKLVLTSPEFETIKATNSVKDVVELIQKEFEATGELLSVEEAAQAVEEHLVEEAWKLANLSKIQKRREAESLSAAKKQQAEPSKIATNQPNQLKTLTNSVGTARQLSSRERALLAFKGELPK